MAELDIIRKSETPNLATLHRLAYAGSYISINSESLQSATFSATIRYLLNYKSLHRPNGEE